MDQHHPWIIQNFTLHLYAKWTDHLHISQNALLNMAIIRVIVTLVTNLAKLKICGVGNWINGHVYEIHFGYSQKVYSNIGSRGRFGLAIWNPYTTLSRDTWCTLRRSVKFKWCYFYFKYIQPVLIFRLSIPQRIKRFFKPRGMCMWKIKQVQGLVFCLGYLATINLKRYTM